MPKLIACTGSGTGGGAGGGSAGAGGGTAAQNLSSVAAISAGDDAACALKTDGTVWCWGGNTYGQLGINVRTQASNKAVKVQGISNAVAIAAGTYFACASLSTGKVAKTLRTPARK